LSTKDEDNVGVVLSMVIVIIFALAGLFYVIGDMVDATENDVIRNCLKTGYWQHDQTRILCSVEAPTVK